MTRLPPDFDLDSEETGNEEEQSKEVSEEELGAVMGPVEMAGFVQVYVRQTTAGLPGTTETGEESKKK